MIAVPDVLTVEHLTKDFATGAGLLRKARLLRAVNDVSLTLARGEALAIVGESGSGKSTIARMICRMPGYTPTSGHMRLDGEDITALSGRRRLLAFRRRVQMIFQDPFGALNPVHTVGWHLGRAVRLHRAAPRAERREIVRQVLARTGLSPDTAAKFPFELSGGQRQRACIARVLATGADVIMADEPTSMLDVSIRIGILNLLVDLKRTSDAAFVYITHDLASARYFAERILVLYAGHEVESGPSRLVIDRPRHPYTRLLISAVPDPERSAMAALEGGERAGEVPFWTPESRGCPFAGRCPHVEQRCRDETPQPRRLDDGRRVRCHLADRF